MSVVAAQFPQTRGTLERPLVVTKLLSTRMGFKFRVEALGFEEELGTDERGVPTRGCH